MPQVEIGKCGTPARLSVALRAVFTLRIGFATVTMTVVAVAVGYISTKYYLLTIS